MSTEQRPTHPWLPLALFFVLAFGLTWSYWIPVVAFERGMMTTTPSDWWAGVAGFGPALAALIVTGLVSGRDGLRELLSRLVRWRVAPWWYAVALFLPLAISLVAIGANQLLGGGFPTPVLTDPTGQPLPPLWQQALVLFPLLVLGFDGLGEELGWRGFALPRLQAFLPALTASIGLGLVWGLWHLPLALAPSGWLANVPFAWFLVDLIAASILFTWLFNHTGGSVLLVILFHAAGNTTALLLPVQPADGGDQRLFLISIGVRWLVAIAVTIASARHLPVRLWFRQIEPQKPGPTISG